MFGQVGIDGFAGPSDLLVIADRRRRPRAARARSPGPGRARPRDAGGRCVGRPRDPRRRSAAPRDGAAETGCGGVRWWTCGDRETGARARGGVRARAPPARRTRGGGARDHVTRAGCVFVGATPAPRSATTSPAPTTSCRRTARPGSPRRCHPSTSSGASPRCMSRTPRSSRERAAPLARAEGFELHARSMEARIRENGPR